MNTDIPRKAGPVIRTNGRPVFHRETIELANGGGLFLRVETPNQVARRIWNAEFPPPSIIQGIVAIKAVMQDNLSLSDAKRLMEHTAPIGVPYFRSN